MNSQNYKQFNYMLGAWAALEGHMLHEFSENGGDGVIEVRFKNGKASGVTVSKLTPAPKNERGVAAGWQLSGELHDIDLKYARLAAMSTTELKDLVEDNGGEMNLALASTLHDRLSKQEAKDVAPQVVCDAQGLEQGSTWLECVEARIYA